MKALEDHKQSITQTQGPPTPPYNVKTSATFRLMAKIYHEKT